MTFGSTTHFQKSLYIFVLFDNGLGAVEMLGTYKYNSFTSSQASKHKEMSCSVASTEESGDTLSSSEHLVSAALCLERPRDGEGDEGLAPQLAPRLRDAGVLHAVRQVLDTRQASLDPVPTQPGPESFS